MNEVKNVLVDRSYKFSLLVISLCSKITQNLSERVIFNQLLRSSTSIGANIVEAKSASSRREYKKYYEIALKSANETSYWLSLLRDTSKLDKTKIERLIGEVDELCRMLGKAVITLKKNL